ncbi:sulfatase-like hydrolase/transferase [Pontiella agarivorans]|uniref:Sulfatase-like hydrolase/transferase n=1 Tax=Pontiella agarivorans TaxID=3038953 RepID=A0ABU5MSA0_9BACT|nr:sulfatase-like hydrolase/transferase [Pontiella agarivorans]MDZ8117064.1 sulfatase-like hydrolase/transferase [Pontiella agarivorans]
MNRRDYAKMMALGVASVAGSSLAGKATRPNLLIIHTDEHNFRTLGCYRNLLREDQAFVWGKGVKVDTPHIDRIANEGAICMNYYAASPVCSPSRASLMSGQYPITTGTWKNGIPMKDEVVTFAEVLRREGYATSYLGKWHLDGKGHPQFAPQRQFGWADNRFMWNGGHWKKMAQNADGSPRIGAVNHKGKPTGKVDGADEESFTTDWLTNRSLEILERDYQQPFCLMVSIPDPHSPNTVRKPYDTLFDNLAFEPPRTRKRMPAGTLPRWRSSENKNGGKVFDPKQMSGYFGMVKCIDDNVGRLLNFLEEKGIADNTVVVFTSDHGDMLYEHDQINKGQPFDGSSRIPFVIRYPKKIAAGKVIHKAYNNTDFAPTILGLMGASSLPNAQGSDCSADLLSTDQEIADDRISYMAEANGLWVATVSRKHKLIYSSKGEPFLFDLEKDPDELVNFYADPAYKTVLKTMHDALVKQMTIVQGPESKKTTVPAI